MRFTIFKSRAFSASVQSIGFIVGGIASTFHFTSSSAQEAGHKLVETVQELGIEAGSKAVIAVNPSIDILPCEALKISIYISTMPRPLEAKSDMETNRHALAGEKIFISVGCVDCHVSDVRPATGIFSDLLLHDMGERLQGPSPSPRGPLQVSD